MKTIKAKTLPAIYDILCALTKPIALWDFFSGELGHEALYIQALGGKFFDDNRCLSLPVVALTWKGCSILHQNTSDLCVELDDADVATMDSEAHRGEGRYRWLLDQGHVEAIEDILGIKARFGPAYWQNGKRNSLQGHIPTNHYLEGDGYKTDWHGATAFIADRLQRTGFRFDAGPRIVKAPYISLFDRNDILKTFRNTQDWHFEFARELADANGLELAVLKGWYERPCPVDAIEFHARHRDLATFVNIVTNSALHLSPPSGTSELAMIAGCDLVALSYYKEHEDLGEKLLRRRGFRYWHYLTGPDCEMANDVRQRVKEKSGWMLVP